MNKQIKLRALKPSDIEKCLRLFQDTVHSVNAKDYSPEQLAVWAPAGIKPSDTRWQTLLINKSFVAEIDDQLVGFADLTQQGYFDRLFVHKDYQGKGIGSALIHLIEQEAHSLGILEIRVEASITAKPLFEKSGYELVKQQEKEVSGVKLRNFVMRKKL